MKRILMTLMMLMCLLGVSAQVVYIYKSDANGNTIGSSVYSTSTSKQDVKIVVDRTSPKFKVYKVDADGNTVGNPVYSTDEMVKAVYAQNALDPHASDYVDLGLSVYWGTKNIGANQIYDIGSYYMWGETTVKTTCTWATYKYGSAEDDLTKYYEDDERTALVKADDAAYTVWGENWLMPTKAQMAELISGCNWTWTNISGQDGYKVSSKTDASKYIFLPVTGGKSGTTVAEAAKGNYWTKTLGDDYSNAYALSFSSSEKTCAEKMRNLGFCIRPVRKK